MSTNNPIQQELQPRYALTDLEPELQALTPDAAAAIHGRWMTIDGATTGGTTPPPSSGNTSGGTICLRKAGGTQQE